jgi:hypothetical protein
MNHVMIADHAEAALASEEFGRALKLAEFIGSGKELTEDGVLLPAAADEARKLLGIDLPEGELLDISGLAALMPLWDVVLYTGLVESSAGHVRATAKLAELRGDPDLAVQTWRQAITVPLGSQEAPCPQCLTVLFELDRADGAVKPSTVTDLVTALHGQSLTCPDCGEVHGENAPEDEAAHVLNMFDNLLVYGAAVGDLMTEVQLTPIGRLLTESVFAPYRPAPEADAAAAVDAVGPLPPWLGSLTIDPWLAARTPAQAVRELLDYAMQANAQQRPIATAIARFAGPGAEEVWRQFAEIPGYGVYGREWLEEQGERVKRDPAEDDWMAAESLSAAMAAVPEERRPVLSAAMRLASGGEVAELLASLKRSGHPDAPRLMAEITAQTGIRPRTALRSPRRVPKKKRLSHNDVPDPDLRAKDALAAR